jgi:leucyl-tRNA synthetase
VLEKLTLLLGPFAPYLAQEIWEELGREGPVFRETWPAYDPELAKEDLAEIVVQVNGKLRSHIHAPFGTSEDVLKANALEDPKVRPFLDGKQIVKAIVVRDRLVNIVVAAARS